MKTPFHYHRVAPPNKDDRRRFKPFTKRIAGQFLIRITGNDSGGNADRTIPALAAPAPIGGKQICLGGPLRSFEEQNPRALLHLSAGWAVWSNHCPDCCPRNCRKSDRIPQVFLRGYAAGGRLISQIWRRGRLQKRFPAGHRLSDSGSIPDLDPPVFPSKRDGHEVARSLAGVQHGLGSSAAADGPARPQSGRLADPDSDKPQRRPPLDGPRLQGGAGSDIGDVTGAPVQHARPGKTLPQGTFESGAASGAAFTSSGVCPD